MNILTIIFWKNFEKETVLTQKMTFSRIFLIVIQLKTKVTDCFFAFMKEPSVKTILQKTGKSDSERVVCFERHFLLFLFPI